VAAGTQTKANEGSFVRSFVLRASREFAILVLTIESAYDRQLSQGAVSLTTDASPASDALPVPGLCSSFIFILRRWWSRHKFIPFSRLWSLHALRPTRVSTGKRVFFRWVTSRSSPCRP